MTIEFKKTVAVLDGICAIEEAETLLEWLLENPKGKLNLKQCEHMHTSILQVLMAVGPSLSAPPANEQVKALIQAAGISCGP
ncbi:MAG: hypothetical protein ABW101_04705 [Candidatus Thiodiazotropha sp.]